QRGLNDQYPAAYDIARDPSDVPAEALPNGAELTLTTHRIETYVAPGPDGVWGGTDDVKFNFLAFGGGHGGGRGPPHPPPPRTPPCPLTPDKRGKSPKFQALNLRPDDPPPHRLPRDQGPSRRPAGLWRPAGDDRERRRRARGGLRDVHLPPPWALCLPLRRRR